MSEIMAPGKPKEEEGHELLELMPTNKDDSVLVVCIIRDETTVDWKKNRIVQGLADDTTMVNFYKIVAEKANYIKNSFLLAFLRPAADGQTDEEVILHDQCEMTIRDIVSADRDKKCHFVIKSKDGKDPIKHIQQPMESSDFSTPETEIRNLFDGDNSFARNSEYSSGSNIKSESGYVGLVNQAMTCYLNSLLQTLFMTPEFRNALYRWKFQGNLVDAAKNIPYQLQILFLKLQTSKKKAVETTDLTKSFGWDSSEAWQQHDVQELCRVMFDALEETLKNTDQADLINYLYQGKMKDYVKCLKCLNESARMDTYLDIPLAIRPFGSKQAYSSIEEAFRAFSTPEILDENNQYFCEKCDSKQNAHKGLKFLSFPYLLTIQLKRFSYDYNTGQRIKLHDKVTFPNIMKLNEFMHHDDTNTKCKLKSETLEEEAPVANGDASNGQLPEHEENDIKPNDSNNTDCNKSSEMYELFSIMIHSGNAVGGHYYAYIKSFLNNQWYCFNDQLVAEISTKEMEKSFGGVDSNSRGYYSASYSSSTNAYMLMYRRRDMNRNAMFTDPTMWPEHIKTLSEKLEEEEEEEINKKVKDRSLCKVRLFCRHPKKGTWIETRLHVHHSKTLREATEIAWKLLVLEEYVELERCRLVKYDDYYGSYERSYEGDQDTQMGVLLGGVKYSYAFDLLMETFEKEQVMPVYEPGGTTIKVYNVNLEAMEVEDPFTVHAKSDYTLADLKTAIEEEIGFPSASMRVAVGKDYQDFRILSETKKTLKTEGFFKFAKVFVEKSDGADFKLDFAESEFAKVLDKYSNTISLNVTLPVINAETKKAKEIVVKIDKRQTLTDLKLLLENHAGADSDQFRVYRVYSNDQEFEITRLNDQLTAYTDETKVIIRHGRALKSGETRIKIYFLRPTQEDHCKFLMEPVVSNGMSIRELKSQIIEELKKSFNIEETSERIRLRKKSWKSPVTIYMDDCVFDRDIKVTFNLEFFVEIVAAELQLVSKETLSVYVRRWCPSQYVIDPFQEVLLKVGTVEEFKSKVSELSDIPVENIEVAKGKGFFPYESSVLDIDSELDWNPDIKRLSDYPMAIIDDGSVIYYKNKEEQLCELSEERRKKIKDKERKRLQKNSSTTYTRKEKALKIYTNSSAT